MNSNSQVFASSCLIQIRAISFAGGLFAHFSNQCPSAWMALHQPNVPTAYATSSISAPNAFNLKPSPNMDPDQDECSPIMLDIQVPMAITGDDNMVLSDVASNVNRVSIGVMHAINSISTKSLGLPMIDENGHARPIKIDVKAHVHIQGSRNVVGEAAVLAALKQSIRRKVVGLAVSTQMKTDNDHGEQEVEDDEKSRRCK